MKYIRVIAASALIPLLCGACSAPERKPRDLIELRQFLLLKAKQKFKHALRITERHSPDPFNQARQQLVYTLIELEEFGEAEEAGREFVQQKVEYLEAARSRLAEVELDWKKELAGNPQIKGTKKETAFLEARDLWEGRVRLAEKQIIGLSLLLGEVYLRSRAYKRAIPVFKEILRIKADHNTALRRISQAYVFLGDHNLAAMYLEKAHKGIMRRIFEIEAEMEPEREPPEGEEPDITNLESVRSQAQQIQSLRRANIEIAAAIGVLYFILKDHPRSDDWFARAFEQDPTSVYLELKLGLALFKEGRTEGAGKHFEKFRKDLSGSGGFLVRILLDRIEGKPAEKS